MNKAPIVNKVIAVLTTMFWLATCFTLFAILSAFIYCLFRGHFFVAFILSFCLFTQILVVGAAWSETETVWEEARNQED